MNLLRNFLKHFLRQYNEMRQSLFAHPRTKIGFVILVGLSLVYVASKMSETKKVIYRDHQQSGL